MTTIMGPLPFRHRYFFGFPYFLACSIRGRAAHANPAQRAPPPRPGAGVPRASPSETSTSRTAPVAHTGVPEAGKPPPGWHFSRAENVSYTLAMPASRRSGPTPHSSPSPHRRRLLAEPIGVKVDRPEGGVPVRRGG